MPTSSSRARCTRRTREPRRAARGGSSRSTPPSSRPVRRDATGRSSSTSPAAWAGASTSRTTTPRRSSRSCAVASTGGTADYAGATWQRIEDEMGLFWPIPEVGHPGTPRLYEDGRFYHPDGKARFSAVPFKESAEVVDDEYPIWLTTGRVVSQYLSGAQTRRIAGLVEQYPEPLCEMHPRLADRLGVADRDLVTVDLAARRNHAAGQRGDDDSSRHRVHPLPLARHTGGQPVDQPGRRPGVQDARVQGRRRARRTTDGHAMTRVQRRRRPRLRHRPEPLHRVRGVCPGVHGMRNAPWPIADPPRANRATDHDHPDGADGLHALRRPDLRRSVSRRRDQADGGRDRPVGAEAAVHRLFQLRIGLPVRSPQDDRRLRPDDEVRHVHRPHDRRTQTDVRIGVPESGPVVRHDRGVRRHPPRILLRDFLFGRQEVRTKVYTVVDDVAAGALDVVGGATASWLDDPFGLDQGTTRRERRASARASALAP